MFQVMSGATRRSTLLDGRTWIPGFSEIRRPSVSSWIEPFNCTLKATAFPRSVCNPAHQLKLPGTRNAGPPRSNQGDSAPVSKFKPKCPPERFMNSKLPLNVLSNPSCSRP